LILVLHSTGLALLTHTNTHSDSLSFFLFGQGKVLYQFGWTPGSGAPAPAWGAPAAPAPAAPAAWGAPPAAAPPAAPAAWAAPPAAAPVAPAPAPPAPPAKPADSNQNPFGAGASIQWGGNENDPSAKTVRLRDRLNEADTERRKAREEAEARERAAEIRREVRLKKIAYMENMPDNQPAGTGT
jgi:hypothetical protein